MYDVDKARNTAIRAHSGQTYGDDEDYMVHVDQVLQKSKEVSPGDPLVEVVALLHDVVEDTDVTLDDVSSSFGAGVATAVSLVTDPKGTNRKERKRLLYERFASAPSSQAKDAARVVKLSDRYCNHKKSLETGDVGKMKMYVREFPEFVCHFGAGINNADPTYTVLFQLFLQYVKMQEVVSKSQKHRWENPPVWVIE